jgi:hypothetical protein
MTAAKGEQPALTSLAHGAGCGCKLPAASLLPIVRGLPQRADERLLVSADSADDAAASGLAVRVGRDMYAHRDALAEVAGRVEAIIAGDGAITLARLRDELGTSRRYAQALLEHLDAARVTLRLPDDRRVLRARSSLTSGSP